MGTNLARATLPAQGQGSLPCSISRSGGIAPSSNRRFLPSPRLKPAARQPGVSEEHKNQVTAPSSTPAARTPRMQPWLLCEKSLTHSADPKYPQRTQDPLEPARQQESNQKEVTKNTKFVLLSKNITQRIFSAPNGSGTGGTGGRTPRLQQEAQGFKTRIKPEAEILKSPPDSSTRLQKITRITGHAWRIKPKPPQSHP